MKFYSQIEPIHLYGCDDPNKLSYNEIPLQPLQKPKKNAEGESVDAILPVNIANGSINISMGKMASGLTSQAANLAAISPSLSLPKLQGNGHNHGHHGHHYAPASVASSTAGMTTASHGASGGLVGQAGASTAAVGDAMNQVQQILILKTRGFFWVSRGITFSDETGMSFN